MSVVSLLKLSRDQLLARAGRVPFNKIDSWRVTVGIRVAKRDKDPVSAAVVDYFSSCLRAEALFGGGSLSPDAENRLRLYFGSLLDAHLVDDAATALDKQLKKELNRLKSKEAMRARRATESADARNARLDANRASKKESRRAAAAAALASTVHSDSTYDACWPQIISKDLLERCCEDYAAATN
ncbi:hypothetical protein M407DRAFT_24507 [Tulasnella calospora MUT 4182]|uniref:Uncharacterized protein n=1 Tax=Tulasnella calospora MUT 4182 TaxID=1051891 RepID=A0A0C3QJ80_9AGAM|nr:hypothetical protein M407DRAFT_24507 [Tulasnella calospora MUT 4182]